MSETAMLEPDGEAPDARALAARVKRLEALLRDARGRVLFKAQPLPACECDDCDLARRIDAELEQGGMRDA